MLQSDKPIANHEEDKFNYTEKAKMVAEALNNRADKDSFVIGINGSWGSGKTSFMNLVVEYLNKDDIILRFSPWWFKGQENITLHFFETLTLQNKNDVSLEDTGKEILDFLTKCTSSIFNIDISFFKKAARIIKPEFTDDLYNITQKIQEKLISITNKIYIIIDDVDRLNKEELMKLFCLIKSIANLPNIVYIIAYDKDKIKEMIDKIGYDGQLYLEKIIQFEIDVPIIGIGNYYNNLAKYFKEIDLVIKDEAIDFISNDLETYRQFKRLCNYISFRLPLIKNINPNAFLYYSYLKLNYPKILSAITTYRECLTDTHKRQYLKHHKTLFTTLVNEINDDLSLYKYDKIRLLIDTIRHLFPLYKLCELLSKNNTSIPSDRELNQYYTEHQRAIGQFGLCDKDTLNILCDII